MKCFLYMIVFLPLGLIIDAKRGQIFEAEIEDNFPNP